MILAAGRGRRLGPLGERVPKVALSVGNRPLYEWHVDMLASQGLARVLVVISPGREGIVQGIRDYARRTAAALEIDGIVQQEPRGIAHALALCADRLDDRFVVLLGDTWLDVPSFEPAVAKLEHLCAVLSVREESRAEVIRRECTIRVDDQGLVQEIREKPQEILGELKPCGLYFFTQEIFAAIAEIEPSPVRGELELTDAIARLIQRTGRVGVAPIVRNDVNISTCDDLVEANVASTARR